MPTQIDIVPESDLTPAQKTFVQTWTREYFGEIAAARDLKSASVHWRLFLSENDRLLSHVGITEFLITIDGQPQYSGAIGGLFTVQGETGNGYGYALMAAAETFLFERLSFDSGILFCLAALLPFYQRRGWVEIQTPVTLQQPAGIVTWPESVMLLSQSSNPSPTSQIHIPSQPPRHNPPSSPIMWGLALLTLLSLAPLCWLDYHETLLINLQNSS